MNLRLSIPLALCFFASQAFAVQLTQADCNYAIEKLKVFNADGNAHPGKKNYL